MFSSSLPHKPIFKIKASSLYCNYSAATLSVVFHHESSLLLVFYFMLHLEKDVVRKETLTIVACLKDLSYTVCSDPVFRVIHTEPALSQDFQTSFYSKSIISIFTLLDKADEHQLLEKWDWKLFFLNLFFFNRNEYCPIQRLTFKAHRNARCYCSILRSMTDLCIVIQWRNIQNLRQT